MTEHEIIYQPEIWFFDPGDTPPSKEERVWRVDAKNPENPFSAFIGNGHAVRRLCRIAFQAFARHNRECSDQSFALLGPPSTGKATLAGMFGSLIGLPFIEIDARMCNDLNDIAVAIATVLESTTINNAQYPTLELQELGNGEFMVPPCVVFIDDAGSLSKKVEHGIRQAVAGKMNTNGFTLDTTAICWIVASSQHLLPDAFAHFITIRLKPLIVDEVAQVVSLHNPDLPAEVCRLVARHASTPRESLAFANEMRAEFEMNGGDWQKIVAVVAQDLGVTTTTPWLNRLRNGQN
jgi:hypothetical protein